MRMRLAEKRTSDVRKEQKLYINTLSGGADLYRAINYVNRDLSTLEELDSFNQVTLVLFLLVAHRNIIISNHRLYQIIKFLPRISLRNISDDFNDKLDDHSRSVFITYIEQAIKELDYWPELDNKYRDDLHDFLIDLSIEIL